MQTFYDRLDTWMIGAQNIINQYFTKQYPRLDVPQLSMMEGKRYIRIVNTSYGQRSVHAFIDKDTGDVLKPAGWKAPAKHRRGNIFDDQNGLGQMGPYGPAYLR